MAQARLGPALAFVPAPADLSPAMLGLVLHRADPGQSVALPAHALAVCSVMLEPTAPVTRPLVTGSATQGRVIPLPGGLMLSMLWRANLLPRLSGEPASTFTDGVIDAADLFGPLPLARWQDRVAATPQPYGPLARDVFGWARRLLAAAPAPRPAATRFGQALAAWQPQAGRARPDGWGERPWQRACRDELGVHPGLLRRLARLHASVREQSRQPGRWADHAVAAGFSDQAHLVREYRELAGLTPTRGLGIDGLQLSAHDLAPRFFGG